MFCSVYPNSTPEFRVLQKQDNTQVLQIRYVKKDIGYTGVWFNIPIVKEESIE
jgi:hypothetical protein